MVYIRIHIHIYIHIYIYIHTYGTHTVSYNLKSQGLNICKVVVNVPRFKTGSAFCISDRGGDTIPGGSTQMRETFCVVSVYVKIIFVCRSSVMIMHIPIVFKEVIQALTVIFI